MRWLKLAVHRLEEAPSMRTFNSSACVFCPLGSALHEKADASERFGGVKCVKVLGNSRANEWQGATSMFECAKCKSNHNTINNRCCGATRLAAPVGGPAVEL
eukprot:7740220-Pyramimonas_sp.AAC.1